MTSQDLVPVWTAGFHGAVGVKDDLPAPAVNAYLMVILAEKPTILDRRLATVLFVDDVMDIRGGCRAVTAPRPGAVLVAQDDRTADMPWYGG